MSSAAVAAPPRSEVVEPVTESARTEPRRRPISGLATLRRAAIASAAIVAFLVLWEIAPRVGLVDPVFLPPFSAVVGAFDDLVRTGAMWEHLSASVFRALIGFTIAIGIAIPVG